ncbi:4-(cytidine 5'-diphospho)-2-C-methyl-D-erythritol kinase [Candidatus Formimonas warabiya]|uniref:4-diphosphocytidyl-2-C-methyl-D-erythritol kinase n=1 Tax=Formimonas warabiya TaxID=1761012 RepID=A0A3G1KX57_FORW1|nr:4-(cytidine 5'-diphospho)-2-C-methyl-D-erythritol kinase [Candidatus Formimonas warabiya]ATW26977.1 4-(cytidine 5'-diphospho)-2-C-methyl-D-erythritol kinase [Candidatus Formimonas warabiya]
MNEIELDAHAKINLSLDVIRKRPDGYHDVKMIMQSISLADRVTVKRGADRIEIRANVNTIPLDERNIAFQAWKLMKEKFHLPGGVSIHLHKEIPVEAGLAGGSTNAAAVLRAVNQIFDLGLTDLDLAKLGGGIGADVAFCVLGGTALAEGIGEILTPLLPLPRIWLVLVNPGFGVSTAEIYRRVQVEKIMRHPDTDALVHAVKKGKIAGILTQMANVLEEVTIPMHPDIAEIKKVLCQAGLSPLMSGSGPTVFGLAPTQEHAVQAAQILKPRWKTVLVAHTI